VLYSTDFDDLEVINEEEDGSYEDDDDDEAVFRPGGTAVRLRKKRLGILGKRNFFALREILDSQKIRIARVGVGGDEKRLEETKRDTVRFVALDDFIGRSADEFAHVLLERIPRQVVEYFSLHGLSPIQAGIRLGDSGRRGGKGQL
jgi:hypothetical protein